MKRSLSVIIPALNEEKNIFDAVSTAVRVLEKGGIDYEVLAFNDGSADRTEEILNEIAAANSRIRVFHHRRNQGLGVVSREAFEAAGKEYITWFSGDNSIREQSFHDIVHHTGEADIIIAYMVNNSDRPFLRRVISRTFVGIMNIIFGLRVKYYTGPSIYPTEMARSARLSSYGYDFAAELLIRLLKSGASYREAGFYHNAENDGNSKAMSWRNLTNVIRTVFILARDVYILRRPRGKLTGEEIKV